MTTQDQGPLNVKSNQGGQVGSPDQPSVPGLTNGALAVGQPPAQGDRQHASAYAELRQVVREHGLLDRQLGYYAFKILSTLALLALSLTVLAVVDTLWIQLVNAAFLGLVFAQIGFIGHDSGHRQIFSSVRNNELISLVICFMLAFERSWWLDKHNRHHNNPNNVALDPDADFPVLAFTKEQALKKKGFFRFIVSYQAFLFYPMLLLEGLGLRLAGVQYAIANKIKYPVAEPLLMVGHFVVYFALLVFFLSPLHAALFFVVHQAVFGLIVGSAFAPNHKGMLMVGEDEELDFFPRQVLTARNVKAHPFTDFWYGGLNYQIEHHLFPDMPRNNLKKAQKITKAFCKEASIPYHETGIVQSQKEILQFLHEESAPLRAGTA